MAPQFNRLPTVTLIPHHAYALLIFQSEDPRMQSTRGIQRYLLQWQALINVINERLPQVQGEINISHDGCIKVPQSLLPLGPNKIFF